MLTLQFIPHAEIESLNSKLRIKKLITVVKENKIILLEGRLTKHEEAELIQTVMSEISTKFKGIEIAVVDPDTADSSVFMRLRKRLANLLLGNRTGFTIIGPASVITEIKRDPSKIELYTVQDKKHNP